MAGIGDGHNGGGSIWAVFDTDAVTRKNWVLGCRPIVDIAGGFFFSADTLAELLKAERAPWLPYRCVLATAYGVGRCRWS